MIRRNLIAVSAGVTAFGAVSAILWATQLQLHEIVFWALLAYYTSVAAALLVQDHIRRLREQERIRRETRRRAKPVDIKLNPVEWYSFKKCG